MMHKLKSLSWSKRHIWFAVYAIILLYVIFDRRMHVLMNETLLVGIPLMLVAMGGLYSERSGIVNIALEGIMIFGAFVAFTFAHVVNIYTLNPQLVLVILLIVGGLAGVLLSLLHAFSSINMRANQVISGTALNLFAPAFSVVMMKFLVGKEEVETALPIIRRLPILSDIPVIGRIFFTDFLLTIYIGLLIFAVATFVLYKTRFGLRLRACGENPQAADAAGINVYRMRYAGVMISGLLAGIGGVSLIIFITSLFKGNASGYGFLALAVLISGQWNPFKVISFSLLFAFLSRLAYATSSFPLLQQLGNAEVYRMLPYFATLVVLAFMSKNSRAPKAAGEPYDQGKR